jgi:hypothetical protein
MYLFKYSTQATAVIKKNKGKGLQSGYLEEEFQFGIPVVVNAVARRAFTARKQIA